MVDSFTVLLRLTQIVSAGRKYTQYTPSDGLTILLRKFFQSRIALLVTSMLNFLVSIVL